MVLVLNFDLPLYMYLEEDGSVWLEITWKLIQRQRVAGTFLGVVALENEAPARTCHRKLARPNALT